MTTLRFLLLIFCIGPNASVPLPKTYKMQQYLEHPAVQNFREYLQIDTSKKENIGKAVIFWRRQALELGLPFAVYRPAGREVCVITWPGTEPALPSIMLNSHMDVVTVEPEDWTYPPFAAHMDENGDIFARGTQDTKDVGIQYIEAIRSLKKQNVTLERTLHVTLMPDEETNGFQGMLPFVNSAEFKALNVGFALDEGIPSSEDTLYVTYQDKRPWQMTFTVRGTAAHASTMPEDSAMEKLRRLIEAISEYRESQNDIMKSGGAYNTLNINLINGGLATNIVPSKMSLLVDMRLDPTASVTEMDDLVKSWMSAAGNETSIEFVGRFEESAATPIEGNPFLEAIQIAVESMGLSIEPKVCPAKSDMLYLRNRGIAAFGFAFKPHTTSRIHGANEYVNVATFLKGIDVYTEILKKLGSLVLTNTTEVNAFSTTIDIGTGRSVDLLSSSMNLTASNTELSASSMDLSSSMSSKFISSSANLPRRSVATFVSVSLYFVILWSQF